MKQVLTILLLSFIIFKLIQMGKQLDALKAEVAKNTSVIDSAETLLRSLKTKLDEAITSGDPAQLEALSAELGQSSSELAAAVVANTPAEPVI